MKLSVIIPVHNEEHCVEKTVRELSTTLTDAQIEHEIVVVNDNSEDRSEELCRLLQDDIPSLILLHNPPPYGFGAAIRKGLEHYTGDAVAVFMGDASDSAKDLVRFFCLLEERNVECVFGSRFMRGGEAIDYPWLKLALNRLANTFIRVLFAFRYNDVTNAFKLYRREVIDGVKPLLSQHFNLTVELPLKAIVRGYRYTVVPNYWINRKSGISKLKIQEMGSRYLFIVLYCFIERWFSKGDYHRRNHFPATSELTGAPRENLESTKP